jgi:type II secretory pathway component PulF
MSNGGSLVALIGLLPVGAALLAAVQIVFGRQGSRGDDSMRRGLTIAGWLSIHLGVLGLLALPGFATWALWLVYLIIVAMAVRRHRHNERRALLAMLAACASRGIPLEQAARAFAEERADDTGLRTARLADALERGAPLPKALKDSRNPLSLDAQLAAGLGWQIGGLGVALGSAVEFREEFDLHLRGGIEKFLYLCWVVAFGAMVATFIMIKIVPAFAEMFAEFDFELPKLTVLIINLSNVAVKYWYLFTPLYNVILLAALLTPFYYIGWLSWEPPGLRRLWRRVHMAWVMQSLALVVRRGRPMLEGLQLLAMNYPREYIAARLHAAAARAAGGEHWAEALRSQDLLRSADAAVLQAGERAGNLAWTLEELSEAHLRRMSYRLRAATAMLFPGLVLLLAVPVFLFAVGLMLPLMHLIRNLA